MFGHETQVQSVPLIITKKAEGDRPGTGGNSMNMSAKEWLEWQKQVIREELKEELKDDTGLPRVA